MLSLSKKVNPVRKESGVRFHCSCQGTASLVAFLNRLPALQAMFNVPVLFALLGSLCLRLALSQVELECGFHDITSSGGIPPFLSPTLKHGLCASLDLHWLLSAFKERVTPGRKKTKLLGYK